MMNFPQIDSATLLRLLSAPVGQPQPMQPFGQPQAQPVSPLSMAAFDQRAPHLPEMAGSAPLTGASLREYFPPRPQAPSGPAYKGPVSPQGGIPDGVDRGNPPLTTASILGMHDTPAAAAARSSPGQKPGFWDRLNNFRDSDRGQALADLFGGWAMGGNFNESLAYGAKMMAAGRSGRQTKAQQKANAEWLMRNGYDETSARALAADSSALTAAIRDIQQSRQPKFGFTTVNGDLVRYDERGAGGAQVVYDSPDARPMTPQERSTWGISADDARPYYMHEGRPHAVGGNGVSVNVGSERGYDKTLGEGFAKRFLDIQDQASSAGRAINALTVMRQAMEQDGFYSGLGAGSVQSLKRLGSALGMDASGITSMETFNALSKQAALDAMGGTLGTGFSNADRDFVIDQVPNLANTPEGNRALIGIQLKLNQRRQKVAQLARDYASQNDGRIDAGFDGYLAKWAENNPLFPHDQQNTGRGPGSDTGRQRARNPKTGEVLEWDGSQWRPVR